MSEESISQRREALVKFRSRYLTNVPRGLLHGEVGHQYRRKFHNIEEEKTFDQTELETALLTINKAMMVLAIYRPRETKTMGHFKEVKQRLETWIEQLELLKEGVHKYV